MSLSFRSDFDPKLVARAIRTLGGQVAQGTGGPLRDAFVRAAARFLAFTRRRFQRLSRSNGTAEWPPLALSTKLARLRKTKRGRAVVDSTAAAIARGGARVTPGRIVGTLEISGSTFEILRDTGVLFNSLTQGDPNNKINFDPLAVTIGTAVKYAVYHQSPTVPGRPPRREIFVDPDPETREAIRADFERAVTRLVRDAQLASVK